MIKLSIITINYNNSTGLRKTIESVLSQTSSEFEYIVIDGKSIDESQEVIRQFVNIPPGIYTSFSEVDDKFKAEFKFKAKSLEEPLCYSIAGPQDPVNTGSRYYSPDSNQGQNLKFPITYWISEPDCGVFHAMNKGIQVAKGEYCQFLNSGDVLAGPDVIDRMLKDLPDVPIVIGNMIKKLPDGRFIEDKGSGFKEPTLFTFYTGTLNHSPAFIKRSLFEIYGYYDENLKIVSDWKWYLQVVGLKKEQVYYRDIDVTVFDMTGISNAQPKLEKAERRKVLEELIPATILADYDRYGEGILQMERLKKYRITHFLVWFIERVLFKLEKWKVL